MCKLPKYHLFALVWLCLFFSETVKAQFDIPEKPPLSQQTSLYDYIGLFTESQKNSLEQKLISYADSTSTQIVIAIISTSNGEDLSLLGAKWGEKWGVGQKDEDNGIFIILAKDDRRIDINTGYGIEYRMSDRTTEQIINRVILPEFKTGNYYAGLDKGTDAIFDALNGEFKENRTFEENSWFSQRTIVIIIFILIWIFLTFKNRKNGGGGTGSLLDVIILSNMGRTGGYTGGGRSGGGSFGGGSSGGGFGGGFGGGSFGGGGASGSW